MTAARFVIGGHFEVARIGLGTNRIADDAASRAVLRAAPEVGVTFIDTADIYTAGESERVIGEELGARDDVLIATKGGYHGAAPETLKKAIDASRARLRRDVIDLYYLHRPDPRVQFEKSLEAIVAARDAGKIRHIGVSNVTRAQVRSARLMTPVAAVQNEYNLAHSDDGGVIDYCAEHGVAFVAYFPLRGGKAASRIAARIGATPRQAALAALVARSPAVVPIPGTRSVAHLEENRRALDFRVGESELRELGLIAG